MDKKVIRCPRCRQMMKVPENFGNLRVRCPGCALVFGYEPRAFRKIRWGEASRSTRRGVAALVEKFAHLSLGQKMGVYLVLLALVITLLSGGQKERAREEAPQTRKGYLLEDPAFVKRLEREEARRRGY